MLIHRAIAVVTRRGSAVLLWLALFLGVGGASFELGAANSPPTANPDSYTIAVNTTLTVAAPGILGNDTDPDGNPMTAVSWTSPARGTLTPNSNGGFTYRPNANYNGTDSFSYRARDGQVSSALATVTIYVGTFPIVITSPPDNQTACPGHTVTFSVGATGTAPVYQWFKGTSALSGQTNATLVLANVNVSDAATYFVRLTNAVSAVTNSVTLAVNAPINATPLTNYFRFVGAMATFSTTPSGVGPFSFTWTKNGATIPNQTNSSLVLSNLTLDDSGSYSVIVSAACRVTNTGTLMVDYCFENLDVMLVIDRSGSMVGQAYTDARTASTNFIRNLRLTNSADFAGLASFNPTGMLNQPLTTNVSLLEQAVSALPPATNGTCVSCGLQAAQDELTSVRHRPDALPILVLLSDGVPHDFDTPSNALYTATQAKKAGTRIFTIGLGPEVDPAMLKQMASSPSDFFVATNSSQLVAVFDAITSVFCRPPSTNAVDGPTNLTVCAGAAATFSVSATGCVFFRYQWTKDGVALAGQTNPFLTIPNAALSDAGVYSVEVLSGCGNKTNSASLIVNPTTEVLFAPVSRTNCIGTTASFSVEATGTELRYQWFKDSSELAGETNNSLALNNLNPSDGGNYHVTVTGLCGPPVNVGADLLVSTPPSFAVAPLLNITPCRNETVFFQATPSGTGPFTFLWRKDGVELAAETNNVLVLNAVSAADVGTYSVEAANACGTAMSSATLTLDAPTIAFGPQDQSRCLGEVAVFVTIPQGPGPFTFAWRKDGALLPEQITSVLALFNVSGADAGVYTAEVSGPCDTVTNSATLSITVPVSATGPSGQTHCPGETAIFSTTPQGTGPFVFAWRKDGALLAAQT
ncbi:MAG TPA: immunoglobulin domain-containing protein, partial [Methylomirabilota bacterium]|nr:immunoglobulin domain-containing protein [Methylomirabilota bacterium]